MLGVTIEKIKTSLQLIVHSSNYYTKAKACLLHPFFCILTFISACCMWSIEELVLLLFYFHRKTNFFVILPEELEFHPNSSDPIVIDYQGHAVQTVGNENGDTDSIHEKFTPTLTNDKAWSSNDRHLNRDSDSTLILEPPSFPPSNLDVTSDERRKSKESNFSESEDGYIPQCDGSAMLGPQIIPEGTATASAEQTDLLPTSELHQDTSEDPHIDTTPPTTVAKSDDSTTTAESDSGYPSLNTHNNNFSATKDLLPISKSSPPDSGFKENTLEDDNNFHSITPNQDII